MQRTLPITIDESTWPQVGPPHFPSSFHPGISSAIIDIPSMLLMIGYLTTPISVTGFSLSEFWAWVRYFAAIAPVRGTDDHLRISQSFSELDPHQKTILSDDFGMGIPMHWLKDRLSFDLIVDGHYFIKHYRQAVAFQHPRTGKRGPSKSPDFVARDTSGRWHVIECKGTQSGAGYSRSQIRDGQAQKQSIIFPQGVAGQRLVCGLSIGLENHGSSQLQIIDPTFEHQTIISTSDIPLVSEIALSGVMSKVLRMSGLEMTASAIASQFDASNESISRRGGRIDIKRQLRSDDQNAKARQELRDNLTQKQMQIRFDKSFSGREIHIPLPRTIQLEHKAISRVIVRQGVNRDVIRALAERATLRNLLDNDWFIGKFKTRSEQNSASLEIGKLFRAEIHLE